MPGPNLLSVFTRFPKELFRVNNGRHVELRARTPARCIYDITLSNGRAEPKALDPTTYAAPNGASMRPNSPYQQSLVSWRFRGGDMLVYAVPEGTVLPEELLLVHERSDHYSLQPAVSMDVDDLNAWMTHFFITKSRAFTREQWLQRYPRATEGFY